MADSRHVGILSKGVSTWNEWRKGNPAVQPDLTEINLQGSNLVGINFDGAKLTGANLSGADLGSPRVAEVLTPDKFPIDLSRLNEFAIPGATFAGANLTNSNLSESNFVGVNLTRADLSHSDLSGSIMIETNCTDACLVGTDLNRVQLSGAQLIGTTMIGAKITGTNFHRVDMTGADLTDAEMGFAVFARVNLSVVKGLEKVRHHAPSSIGIDTIYVSSGGIPETFLRGAGVPQTFLAYVASLVAKPIEYFSCFISYSAKDQLFAERLHTDLQANGVRCWFAAESMKIGDRIRIRIDESIRLHDKLLLVLSMNSVHSGWVEKEVETAFEQERRLRTTVLFPISIDNTVLHIDSGWPADVRRTRHIGDFQHWQDSDSYKKAFDRLLRDLAMK